jgi:hypothetical protein
MKPKQKKALWTQIRDQHRQGISPPKVRTKRINPRSKAMAKRMREYDKLKAEAMLNGRPCDCAYWCKDGETPICGKSGQHQATDIHHVRGRVGPLLLDQRSFIYVCRTAHQWIGNNPAKAKELGLIQGPWNHQPK